MNVKTVTKKQKAAMMSMSQDYKPLSPGKQYVTVMLVLCILNDELFECCLRYDKYLININNFD